MRSACLILLYHAWVLSAVAQESRATLLGFITDATGAGIPGASVTATNVETEVRSSTQSNSEGGYVLPFLAPGVYRLRVEQEGFRSYERTPVELRLGERVRLDAALTVGPVNEKVSVIAETPLLSSADASLGTLIDARSVADLPVAHGNAYHLTQLASGVSYAGNATLDRPYDPSHIVNYSMAGAPGLRNEITLDGAPNSSITGGRNQTAAAYVPPADMISEMRVTTVALDASVGHTEGGVINLGLKSGANSVHATAYYNNQSPELFANSWLANKRAQPRPDFRYDRWGGSLLGPAVLPKLYDGLHRTFFAYGYEGIRERRPRNLGDQTVPTTAERNGDFSALLPLGVEYKIYDPATRRRRPDGSIASEAFPGNIIPEGRLSPIAQNILRYYGPPNAAGTSDGQNNLARPDLAEQVGYSNHAWRVDHNSSERNRLFISAARYDRASRYLDYFENAATGEEFSFTARRAAIDEVYVLSSNTVLNLRYAYNRFIRSADFNPLSRGFDLTTLAPGNASWAAWNQSIDPALRRFPLIDIAGYFNLIGASTSGVVFRPQDTHSFAGALHFVRGQHTLKAGSEYRVYRKADFNPYPAWVAGLAGGSSTGWLQFGENWTKGPTDTSPAPPIGAGLASFLLGLPTGGGIDQRASLAEQSTVSSVFLHDEWKPAKNLTLSFGLRYEVEGPLTERFDRSVRGFDPLARLPIEQQVAANYAAIAARIPELPPDRFAIRGGVAFPNVNGLPRALYARDINNLMPRAGLAYSFNPATVMRFGYGVYYGALGVRRGDVYQTGFSLTTPLVPSADNGLSFLATLDNPFPTGALPAPGSSRGPMTGVGDAISFFNTNYAAPRMQRWQFSVQRRIGARRMVELAYVGNRGDGLETVRNINGLPLEYLSTRPGRDQARIDYLGRQDLDNPFYGVLPATTPLGSSHKISRAALLTAYPQFTRMETTTNEGYSRYHAFEARLEERFGNGHSASVSYTWSKWMDASAYLNEMDAAPYYAVAAGDYPHRLAASWVYELPFAHGWQIGGIYVYQSGPPLSFGDIVFTGDIKDIPLPPDQRNVERWFNTGAGFLRDSSQAPAFNRRNFPLRLSSVRGPAMNNWDLSILKNTKVGDKAKLQFRAEFLNAMNHAWFAAPNTVPTSTGFGSITAEQGYMRRVQLGLKLIY